MSGRSRRCRAVAASARCGAGRSRALNRPAAFPGKDTAATTHLLVPVAPSLGRGPSFLSHCFGKLDCLVENCDAEVRLTQLCEEFWTTRSCEAVAEFNYLRWVVDSFVFGAKRR